MYAYVGTLLQDMHMLAEFGGLGWRVAAFHRILGNSNVGHARHVVQRSSSEQAIFLLGTNSEEDQGKPQESVEKICFVRKSPACSFPLQSSASGLLPSVSADVCR